MPLEPQNWTQGGGLQVTLGADLDIWLMTLGRPTLNTLHASCVWATSLLRL